MRQLGGERCRAGEHPPIYYPPSQTCPAVAVAAAVDAAVAAAVAAAAAVGWAPMMRNKKTEGYWTETPSPWTRAPAPHCPALGEWP